MRLVIQRVSKARVTVDDEMVGAIGPGLVLLVGVGQNDTETEAGLMAEKVSALRIFNDEAGKMNLSARDVGAEFLAISQFTLYANTSRGRRPSFIDAAGPDVGERVYDYFVARLAMDGSKVATGRFGAHMMVDLTNDGPVTITLDSEAKS